jgi:hypothetical protein
MNYRTRLQITAVLVSVCACATAPRHTGATPTGVRFTPPDSTFTVRFPAHLPSLGGTVPSATKMTHYYVNDRGTQFSVQVFENEYYKRTDPAVVLAAIGRTRLDSFAPGATLTDSVVRIGGHTGRGGRITGTWTRLPTLEQRTRVYRVFVAGGRLYEVWAFTLTTAPLAAGVDAFVDSFRLCDTPRDCR